MNKKYVFRFLLGDILALISIWIHAIIINYSYNETIPPTNFVHNLKVFLLTKFDNGIVFIVATIFFLIVLLIDLIIVIFKGKIMLKYTAITLLSEIVILAMLCLTNI